MVPKYFLKPLLGLGLVHTAFALKSQAEANAVCERQKPGTVAFMKLDGSGWGGCITPPPPSSEVCFDEPYTNPKTGAQGCCPDGKPYSFDALSLEGKCCPPGSPFSYDPTYKIGDCCGSGIAFKCSCGGESKPVTPLCPGKNNEIYISGGHTFKVLCGTNSFGTPLPTSPGKDVKDCADKCAALSDCVSSSYNQGHCYPKSAVSSAAGDINVDTVVRDPPNMQESDTCPGLSTDGSVKRVEGGVTYKFFCGKWPNSGGPLKPGYKVASLQQCVKDCNANPACKSAYYGFANVGNQNRVGECNLLGTTQANPGGIDKDFVAAIPEQDRGTAPMQDSDTCPALGTDGSQKRSEGGIEYKFFCGKWSQGEVLKRYTVKNLKECLRDCSANPSCVGLHFGHKGSRVGECVLQGATEVAPTGVSDDFVAAIPDPPRKRGEAAMQASDNCPGLGTDQQQKRTQGGTTFGFLCGRYVNGAGLTVLKTPYKTTNLQECVQHCADLSTCRGLHYGLSTAGTRANECVLIGGPGGQTAGATSADWVAVIAIGR